MAGELTKQKIISISFNDETFEAQVTQGPQMLAIRALSDARASHSTSGTVQQKIAL
jgi:hypothetical protein